MVAVARTTRRKKQDRRRRQQRQAAHARQRVREELVMTAVAQMQEVMERLRAPDTPPAEVADLLAEVWGDEGVPPGVLLGNTIPGGPERLAQIAEAAGKRVPGSVLSRVLAAELRGVVEQDQEGGLRILDELLPGLPLAARINVAWRAIALGAPARAAGIARQVLMAIAGWDDGDGSQPGGDLDPEQREDAASAAERLLAAAVHVASEQPTPDDGHSNEVSPAEAFQDPAVLRSLEAGFARWLARTPQAAAVVAEQVTELRDVLPEDAAEVIPLERAESLARCHALLLGGDDEDSREPGPDDDSGALVRRFAADPSVPAAQAEVARRWADTIHFGLWQLDEPPPEPAGCHLTDLVTSVEHFVPLDPVALGPLGRWSVLLSPLVCVDGVWRVAAPMLLLDPAEGDALAELVQRMSDAIVAELSGHRRHRSRAAARPAPFGMAPPHGVPAAGHEAASPEVARVLSMIVGSGMARLIAETAAYRLSGPRLQNTDGDPMVLVKATLAVDDLDAVTGRLAEHPDIGPDEEAPGGFTWWGRALTEAEREPLLAQAASQLGVDPSEIEADGVTQRWLRGRVARQDDHLVLEVNSLARLERFCDLLRDLGASPTVTGRTTVDPAQDMMLPRGQLIPAGLSREASQAWAQHWLDEKVPALKGRTPRQAALSDRHWPLLEALLRQFEWQQDMRQHADPAVSGGGELAWLREQLQMPTQP
jgi:hypothetical protein